MALPSRPRTVLVTGASSGIGRAATLELARRGHQVFAAARRTDRLEELVSQTPRVTAVTLDLTSPESLQHAIAEVMAATAGAGVDVLINNAGFALGGPMPTLSAADLRRQFETNFFGLLEITRAVLPSMQERKRGRIINVSSVLAHLAMPGLGAYAASKAAVGATSDALRMEIQDFGIDVVLIEPAFTATEIGGGAAEPAPDVDKHYAAMARRTQKYVQDGVAKGVSPERVAKAIRKAVELPHPKPRYTVPRTQATMLRILGSFPDRTADRLIRRAVGIAGLPK
jgi:NAD(P)-dependent dehydrogenase (short-subunit alcohol dehydrogenase family)